MALTNRRQPRMLAPRRRRLRPPLVALFVLTMVVIALIALGSTGASETQSRTETQAYLDRVRPLLDRSTSTGADVRKLREQAVTLGREGLSRQLARAVIDSAGVLTEARALRPPKGAQLANDILVGALAGRASAARDLQPAIDLALSDADAVKAVQALVQVGRDLLAGDGACALFARNLPAEAAATLPKSVWVADPDLWSAGVVGSFVTGLRNNTQLAPVHDVAVVLAEPDPAPLGKEGVVRVLPDVRHVDVQVVVANKGNIVERDVEVIATLQPLDGGRPAIRRDVVTLEPGQNKSMTLAELLTPQVGTTFAISVKIGPVAQDNDPADDEVIHQYVLR